MQRKTKEEVITAFRKVHGEQYDYSHVEYIDTETKIRVKCREHGVFEVTPSNHKKGKGCPSCGRTKSSESRKKKHSQIISEFQKIHGNRYNYSQVQYTSTHKKVKIKCGTHGEFEQSPSKHLNGQGCPECGREKMKFSQRTDLISLINEFKEVHGQRYDYSLVEYGGGHRKVKLKCTIHGIFEQLASNHLRGAGCPKCGVINSHSTSRRKTEEVVADFKSVHGNRYSYALVDYVSVKEKVKIICETHGTFEQLPNHHRNGHGCPD